MTTIQYLGEIDSPLLKYRQELCTLHTYLQSAPWLADGMPLVSTTSYLMALCEELRRVNPWSPPAGWSSC